ncbi:Protein of unknown function [Clostridium cavendishii DSM 21758]|uniref:DUF2691 domain-containing protein n=1 Tax=Clostridium cavendishii DSM 21758 TaxID=1121302 RepID=A0A1M6NN83_9CLOT|nr:DUF2691 family protein [Clostridium cavendishii]SHJ97143.1 Protein of unknown function [Clostridium cavendishii DSM 21758]
MINMGVSFKIPNEYGNHLSDILEPLPFNYYQWLINNDEIHIVHDNEFTNQFLFDEDKIISGEKLYEKSKNNTYYMVFVTLRAFLKDGTIKSVSKYKEFTESDCQIILAVYDCSYVIFWCKNSQLVSKMYMYALSKGYEDIKYITEEELIKNKYYIE